MTFQHQSRIKILILTSKNFWLLLIPMLRGLVALKFDLYNWASGAWLDILVILFILGTAYFRWQYTTYKIQPNSIHYKSGIFLKSSISIDFCTICSIVAEERFILRPFKAVHIYIDTNSGIFKKPDLSLTIPHKEYQKLFDTIKHSFIGNNSSIKYCYKPSKFNLIIFSFIFSSTLSGTILIATVIIQSGKIVGRSLEKELLLAVDDVAQKLTLSIPPLALGISAVIVSGWLISIINNLLRHLRFKIERRRNLIQINTGFFTNRNYFIHPVKINYADLRQSLLMKLCSIMSVHVNCSGYGKAKNEIPVFIPITTTKQIFTSLQLLLPNMPISKQNTVRPEPRSFFRFIWLPLTFIGSFLAIGIFLYLFFPNWKNFTSFMLMMLEIPALWFLLCKIFALFTTGLSIQAETVCVRYSRAYFFHTILIPREKIAKIAISQGMLQRNPPYCDITIYTTNEFSKAHEIISLPLNQTLAFLKQQNLLYTDLLF